MSANIAPQKLFAYDPIGNLLSKSDVRAYTYPLAGSALPHAVSAVAGAINSTFTYDPSFDKLRRQPEHRARARPCVFLVQ